MVDLDGHRLWYRAVGSGPVALLIHGFAVDHGEWEPLVVELLPYFRCLLVDLPGFGASVPAEAFAFTPDAYAGILVRLLDHDRSSLPDAWASSSEGRVTVIGHSMGGGIAIALAAQQPSRVAQLVLIDSLSFPFAEPLSGQLLRFLWKPLARHFIRPLLVRRYFEHVVLRGIPVPDPVRLDRYCNHYRSAPAREWALAVLLRTLDPLAVQRSIARVKAETLIVWGKEDRLFPLRFAHRLQGSIPGASLLALDGCSHLANEEAPQLIGVAIREHHRGHTTPRAPLALAEREFLWNQFSAIRDMYESHVDTLVKVNTAAFAIAGALITFVMSQSAMYAPAMVVVFLMSGSIFWAFRMSHELLDSEVIACDEVRGRLGLEIPPDLRIVQSLFRVFSMAHFLIAVASVGVVLLRFLRAPNIVPG
jgi:pimeloyl-ACP methyl ester carboxylesterase